jgi:hypothetical protein
MGQKNRSKYKYLLNVPVPLYNHIILHYFIQVEIPITTERKNKQKKVLLTYKNISNKQT